MRDKNKSGNEGAPAWMATFADMMSLLLTFFVLLLSFASMDIIKFKDAMGSINEALGFTPSGTGMFRHTSSPAPFEIPKATSATNEAHAEIKKELDELIEKNGLEKDVEAEHSERGVVLRVRGKMFFSSGTARLKEESLPVLEKIADLMKKFPGRISIEGHTDNIPVQGGSYSSNWELSTARAYSALKFLQDSARIDARRMNIAGFGDTHPIGPNDTPEGRSKNRRVEFVFDE